jgi:ribosomal protein S18 acetylase RimI-like enzyme
MSPEPNQSPATIRHGIPAEAEACVALWLDAVEARDGYIYAGLAEHTRAKFETPVAWVVAEHGNLAGFALGTPPGSGLASDPPSALVLGLLAVAPAEQGSGTGRQLLTAFTDAAVAAGYRQGVLRVLQENTPAVRLYESQGWIPFGAPFAHAVTGRPVQTYSRDLA